MSATASKGVKTHPTTVRDNASRTYNGNNQRSNTGYTYDGNGNPTTYATVSHTFDKENRLTGHGSTSYDYRADGLRAWQQTTFLSSTEKRYYLYDQGNVVCELNTAGSVVATNVYAPDGLVGRTNGTTTWQYLFDWQGNAAHGMTSSSVVSISSAFTAWGQRNYVYPFQMPSQWDDCMAFNARWGYLKDASGYYYCQNRYYDPANGRWLTRDPIGFAGGINVYGYCSGGPVGTTDPSGLDRNLTIAGDTSGDARWGWLLPDYWGSVNGLTKSEAYEEFERATGVTAWGHGGRGSMSINENDSLRARDLREMASRRRLKGLPKLKFLSIDQCAVLGDKDFALAALELADEVRGFHGWTIEPATGNIGDKRVYRSQADIERDYLPGLDRYITKGGGAHRRVPGMPKRRK